MLQGSRRLPLNQQNSLDGGNEGEEWETASESSEVLLRSDMPTRDSTKENRQTPVSDTVATSASSAAQSDAKRDVTKKSFSSQRPTANQNRRERRTPPDGRSSRNDKPANAVNGQARGASSRKENINVNVYRVDRIEHANPGAMQSAMAGTGKYVH